MPLKNSELVSNKEEKNDRTEGLKQESTADRAGNKDRKVSTHTQIENSRHNNTTETKYFKETIEIKKSNSQMNTGKSGHSRTEDGVKNEMGKENQTSIKSQPVNNSANFKVMESNIQNIEINSDKTTNINQADIAGMPEPTIRNIPKATLSKATVQRIVHILSTAKSVKNNTASFKIDGGDLGQLEIKFTKDKDNSDAKILVVSEVTRAVIQKMLPTIQTELVEKGINLSSLEVEVDHSAQNEKNGEARNQKENKQSVMPDIFDNEDNTDPEKKIKDYGYNTIELIA